MVSDGLYTLLVDVGFAMAYRIILVDMVFYGFVFEVIHFICSLCHAKITKKRKASEYRPLRPNPAEEFLRTQQDAGGAASGVLAGT